MLPFNSGKWQNALQVISIRSRFTVINASILKRAGRLGQIQKAGKIKKHNDKKVTIRPNIISYGNL